LEEKEGGEEGPCQQANPGGVEGEEESGDEHQQMCSVISPQLENLGGIDVKSNPGEKHSTQGRSWH